MLQLLVELRFCSENLLAFELSRRPKRDAQHMAYGEPSGRASVQGKRRKPAADGDMMSPRNHT